MYLPGECGSPWEIVIGIPAASEHSLAQLRDPASMNNDEEGSRKTPDVNLGLPYMHIHVQANDPNMKTYACMPHTHIHILKIHKKNVYVFGGACLLSQHS